MKEQKQIIWSEVSKIFKEIFPKQQPKDWKIIQLTFYNYLSPKGDVSRIVEICLESQIDDLNKYEWRIPLPKPNQKRVYGLSVHDGHGEILEHKVTYYRKNGQIDNKTPDYALIEIYYPALKRGQRMTIRLEYFVENYADIVKNGIFSKLWRYSWSYKVFSETRKFEHRVILPPKCVLVKNGVTSNVLTQPLTFSYGDKEMTIWMVDNPPPGDLSGEVIYKQETATGPMVISIGAGVFISGIISLLLGGLTWLSAAVVFGVSFIGIFVTLYITKKLLPTYE